MKHVLIRLMLAVVATASLASCAQQPVSTTQEVDNRPQVSFTYTDPAIAEYDLYIDGAAYGQVGDYMHPERALQVISGPHLIEVKRDSTVIFSTKVHYSENTDYTVKVVSQ